MEKVNKDLFAKGSKRVELLKLLDTIEKEEVILFKREEKDFESPVNITVYQHFSQNLKSDKKFSVKKNDELKGWLIKRVK